MIRELGISLLAIAGFGAALWRCRLVAATEDAVQSGLAGLLPMLDRELDDDAKEVAVRRAGLDLIIASLRILWRLAVALAAAAAPILLADGVGLVARDAVLELMLRWDYIVVLSLLAMVLATLVRRWRPTPDEGLSDDDRYSTADQFLHAIAFSSPRVLTAASRIEDRVLSTPADVPTAPPIFVTSLARGGTTALLNALHDVPEVATHTYRDMPFLTAPSLGNRLAGGSRRRVDRRERAHGDGLEIDLDSPEAFEEVLWKLFWPEKYRASTIALWRADDRKEDAERFLERHMGKVVRARRVQGGNDGAARYCSKNNTNIARLSYLADVFPDCRIVVPVRRPECHAASLLRQHQNFLERQAEDDFVRRYMRDIGHFEFGRIHRPIRFAGFDPEAHDPESGDYWLNYWIHTFREVLAHRATCLLVTQDVLRSSPQETMTSLCDALGLSSSSSSFASYFRSRPDEARTDVYDATLHDEATDLYRELEALALSP